MSRQERQTARQREIDETPSTQLSRFKKGEKGALLLPELLADYSAALSALPLSSKVTSAPFSPRQAP